MNHELVTDVPLFAGARHRDRHALAALADEVAVPAATRLTSEGRLASEFFVVLEGRADVSSGGQKLGEVGPGDFFGELGLLEGCTRTATVVASSPMELLVVGPREFATLLERFPVVAERVRRAAASRSMVPLAAAA